MERAFILRSAGVHIQALKNIDLEARYMLYALSTGQSNFVLSTEFQRPSSTNFSLP